MKRVNLAAHLSLLVATLFLCAALALPRPARADVDVHFGIGNAPPPPTIEFQARPHRWYDRRSRVYVIDDPGVGNSDVFQYGGWYWVFNDGYWYRSHSYRGDWRVVDARYVPTQIYGVPAGRWHNHPSYASWHDHMRGRSGGRGRDMRGRDQGNDRPGRRGNEY